MGSLKIRILSAIGAVCALGVIGLPGCGGEQKRSAPGVASTGRLTLEVCELDPSPETMILSLRWLGGLSFYSSQYRLFGDGRLLREIIPQLKPDQPLRVDEVLLARDEIDLIFQGLIEGGVATITTRGIQKSLGVKSLAGSVEDAGSAVLTIRLASCQTDAGLIAPYSHSLGVTAPEYWAERFPESRELESFNQLIAALDQPFPESVSTAFNEALSGGQD